MSKLEFHGSCHTPEELQTGESNLPKLRGPESKVPAEQPVPPQPTPRGTATYETQETSHFQIHDLIPLLRAYPEYQKQLVDLMTDEQLETWADVLEAEYERELQSTAEGE